MVPVVEITSIENAEDPNPARNTGVDQVLITACYTLSTGNQCLVTPMMKRRPDNATCGVVIEQIWRALPSEEELRAVQDSIEDMLGEHVQVMPPTNVASRAESNAL